MIDRLHRNGRPSRREARTLIGRLNAGAPYAISFGGQGSAWLPTLADTIVDADIESRVAAIVESAERMLAPAARWTEAIRPEAFDPIAWTHTVRDSDQSVPQHVLSDISLSAPGVLLAQLATIESLRKQGLDTEQNIPVAVIGHSQGSLAVDAVGPGATDFAELLAVVSILGVAGMIVGRREGLDVTGDGSPMLAVRRVDTARMLGLLAEYRAGLPESEMRTAPVLAIRNSATSVVLSGAPRHLRAFAAVCDRVAAEDAADRQHKRAGGAPFAPVFDHLMVDVACHHPGMLSAVELAGEIAEVCGLDPDEVMRRAHDLLVAPVNWPADVGEALAAGADWILDFGPADLTTRLAAPLARGRGVGLVPVAQRAGQRSLFVPGCIPEVSRPYRDFAPTLAELPDGRRVVQTAFTRLTGRSPILLAGMTPTTVDPAIVAAAANAGHWAELAGGGQVTAEILEDNLAALGGLLEPGRQVQFNALYLDADLWRLQLGERRLVQKARENGAPIDGVIVSAGIPELDDAVALIRDLVGTGFHFVAFKPGTVEQIRSVVRIAAEVPEHPVVVQIEGGRAGGHHSWEDLDDLLLATYGELRDHPNVVICAGGGIGTPEAASSYLTGTWSAAYEQIPMPIDGVLVGTAAMAAAEAATSPAVKRLLVDTPGCPDWIGAGSARGGMASGRSQLDADLHEIDNSASACGRLLDEVAGDPEAVAARRDEIVAAMAVTAKPYFGDVGAMTYRQWLARYAALTVGERDTDRIPWADASWERRFAEMLARTEARLSVHDSGEWPTLLGDAEVIDDPYAAIDRLREAYPNADTEHVYPADVEFFLDLCRAPGKPVNFVPVIDRDVRRWWRSDSLWQAHDERYAADAVSVIPGPVSVAGITGTDEPIGDLLGRFESRVVDDLGRNDSPVDRLDTRKQAIVGGGVLGAVLAADDVQWAGRIVRNPVGRLGDAAAWEVVAEDRAEHASSGACVERTADGLVELEVPIAGARVRFRMCVDHGLRDGGIPWISADDAAESMRSLLAVSTRESLVDVTGGRAETVVLWDCGRIVDHAAATGVSLSAGLHPVAPLQPGGFTAPDALVGQCWPAVFSVLGSATTPGGEPVVEGLLDLVHLDHSIEIVGEIPVAAAELTISAQLRSVVDTAAGRVVDVGVQVHRAETPIASLTERFVVRGRRGRDDRQEPLRAGGAARHERPIERRAVRSAALTAPTSMVRFAAVTGDHNPIHTDDLAARLAGLGTPIVHGMWLSAAAQQVVTATDEANPIPRSRALVGWTARYLGMVRPGDVVEVTVERVGVDAGRDVIEVMCKVGDDPVMSASAVLAPPRTVYAFPGQGVQARGMGLDAWSRSPAARQIWDRADAHTRASLGFSILAVVRDNPTKLVVRGSVYTHPDGVLFLTQFTQVAMATVAVAQVAELKESGRYVEDAYTCGHSVGEYNALAAGAGVVPLEAVLDVVFERGAAMHRLVPRDAEGRSAYRMAVIRPDCFGLDGRTVGDFVAAVAADCGEFLEVVNHNVRHSQYAVAGTVRGLEYLGTEIEERATSGAARAFGLVPGVDVPFHSSVLRAAVPEFRRTLEALLPTEINPGALVGRYVPNLVPRLFSLSRDFVMEIADLVPSEPLREVLGDWSAWSEEPRRLTRVILIELLAWQFASPVRWIETQDLLFAGLDRGGLDVQRFVEVGLKAAPTLSNLASRTLRIDDFEGAAVEVVNLEREMETPSTTAETAGEPRGETAGDGEPAVSSESVQITETTPAEFVSAGPRPDDLEFGPGDAVRAVVALWTKLRPDQISATDTVETLCDGVSSRRNQLLLDIGAELEITSLDGAAEADLGTLTATVDSVARGYRPLGPVLTEAIGDQLHKVVGPEGKRATYIADRVGTVWQLGPGWALHTQVELALGVRDGASVRGGDLGGLLVAAASGDGGGSVDALIDRAVGAVGAAHGVQVAKPETAAGPELQVDAAALARFTADIVGPSGALASAAHAILSKLGLERREQTIDAVGDHSAHLLRLVETELGPEWARTVAPAFDERKAVQIDDRWASAREDLARLWSVDDPAGTDTGMAGESSRFIGAGRAVAEHASWWRARARATGRRSHERFYAEAANAAALSTPGSWSDDVAVVTGASRGSIAASVTALLLAGGATVVATTSHLDGERLAFYKDLYRRSARGDAVLWVVPANMASYSDVDGLVSWIGSEQVEHVGGVGSIVKPALKPTILLPFAAPRVSGDVTEAGGRAELEMKVLLWSVERLLTGLAGIGVEHDVEARLHVILPGSPNRGVFGNDGAYAESKAAFDSLVAKWKVEESWRAKTSLVHVLLGWVDDTSLMSDNSGLVPFARLDGVDVWSSDEIARELLALCAEPSRAAARKAPITADLTRGFGPHIDVRKLARQAAARAAEEATESGAGQADDVRTEPRKMFAALPGPVRLDERSRPEWPALSVRPEDLVVIVGAGELGPYGSARTRFEVEVDDRLSAAGVLELAWSTGMIRWVPSPGAGWCDTVSGEPVAEADIADRYHDAVIERCGIRRFADEGAMVDGTSPLLASVFLDEDLTFAVASVAEAQAFVAADPERTRVRPIPDSDEWEVTRSAGTEIRVPRRIALTRTVGGQIPTGFDPVLWGIPPEMLASIDRLAAWNIVTTVDAFLSSGFTPTELMRWVHPGDVANTQGSGMGGMRSMRELYVDALLGEQRTNDALQEALANVVAAHVVQSYVGSYGAMVHPVAACATAAVSVEEGMDKIRLGKALFAVAGGFDDLGIEGVVGFADMAATAESATMSARGIAPERFSRPNDRRRGGFVESQGGGTILLARGDVAEQMGLPVLGVVAWAQSFGDGVHTSIPAPGIGALGAARGSTSSPLARALRTLGVGPDDIGVVSKHDTSTRANDPNEAALHQQLATALGRSDGAPLFVVSQKSLTGHAKGGAAAFQLIGLCQMLQSGVIPPNRSLDCVDPRMREFSHLVWPRETLRFDRSFPLRAGLVTSLGFGHVSALVAVVHSEAFVASLDEADRDRYRQRAEARERDGARQRLAAMCGGAPAYRRPVDRRFEDEDTAESRTLLDPAARLGDSGTYLAGEAVTTAADD
ncbi:fatty acid synthase subunit beta domain-containing protein [Gordonia sp. (in: high G+C Gram-positive bacteria)]|uniref:fatty acid synthase subunit beta domain-containing protein n=1 Tax=Gordonia sp. (in: high G+C Gram-positive bacteria) TaxID=84139 RepID=UPI0035276C3F